jgi:hypothetical protein
MFTKLTLAIFVINRDSGIFGRLNLIGESLSRFDKLCLWRRATQPRRGIAALRLN